VKIWSVVLRPERKPHWASFSYFAASFFKALGNVNVNYLKIPKKHHGPHKTPWQAACSPRTACLRPLM